MEENRFNRTLQYGKYKDTTHILGEIESIPTRAKRPFPSKIDESNDAKRLCGVKIERIFESLDDQVDELEEHSTTSLSPPRDEKDLSSSLPSSFSLSSPSKPNTKFLSKNGLVVLENDASTSPPQPKQTENAIDDTCPHETRVFSDPESTFSGSTFDASIFKSSVQEMDDTMLQLETIILDLVGRIPESESLQSRLDQNCLALGSSMSDRIETATLRIRAEPESLLKLSHTFSSLAVQWHQSHPLSYFSNNIRKFVEHCRDQTKEKTQLLFWHSSIVLSLLFRIATKTGDNAKYSSLLFKWLYSWQRDVRRMARDKKMFKKLCLVTFVLCPSIAIMAPVDIANQLYESMPREWCVENMTRFEKRPLRILCDNRLADEPASIEEEKQELLNQIFEFGGGVYREDGKSILTHTLEDFACEIFNTSLSMELLLNQIFNIHKSFGGNCHILGVINDFYEKDGTSSDMCFWPLSLSPMFGSLSYSFKVLKDTCDDICNKGRLFHHENISTKPKWYMIKNLVYLK